MAMFYRSMYVVNVFSPTAVERNESHFLLKFMFFEVYCTLQDNVHISNNLSVLKYLILLLNYNFFLNYILTFVLLNLNALDVFRKNKFCKSTHILIENRIFYL